MRDAIVALAELASADDTARDGVLELLGLTRTERDPDRPPLPPPMPAQALPLAGPVNSVATPPVAPVAVESKGPSRPLVAELKRADRVIVSRPPWLPAVGGSVLTRAREADEPPLPPSIFAPLERRGIYTAALSTWVEEGEFDVERAVNELAHARPLRSMPRRPLRTLRRGVQLLLDQGPNMAPYAADVRGLEGQLANLLSGTHMERLFFVRCPTRGVRASLRARSGAWRAPPRGMPVLVASDFGMADAALEEDAASVAEWRRFALEVRAEGHAVIGLMPFAAVRWPALLVEAITFIHWSEHTTAGAVDRAVREAHRRLR